MALSGPEDEKFGRACVQSGLTAETSLDSATRKQVAAWESTNLPAKGLARVLFHI